MNNNKSLRLINKYGLRSRIRKAKPYAKSMKKTKEHGTLPNILKREFKQKSPYMFLSTDITYLYLETGKPVYLSVIKDISSREIVSFNLSNHMDLNLVTETIDKLKERKDIDLKNSLIHSDQGAQ